MRKSELVEAESCGQPKMLLLILEFENGYLYKHSLLSQTRWICMLWHHRALSMGTILLAFQFQARMYICTATLDQSQQGVSS